MTREALLDDIRVLTSMLERAEHHEERVHGAADADAHIEAQVVRLQEAELKLERRLLEIHALDDDDDRHEAEGLERKLEHLREKIATLQRSALENEVLDAAAHAARPPGVRSRLRRSLRELIRQMRADPETSRSEIASFQNHLADLVRERRHALDEIAQRVADGRGYLASARDIVHDVVVSVRGESFGPDAEPYSGDRDLAATRVGMAETAVGEAHAALLELAHDWSELRPLADRPDWGKLPFKPLARLLTAPSPQPFVERIREADEMTAAMALWVDELREAVATAPPPS